MAGVAEQADYLPRTWAKLEIDRLVADGAEKNKARIIELSKAMYVMSPFTSLLVLENEEMYAQYHVDRGRKDHWAMYACPERIPVVNEPLAGPPQSFRQGGGEGAHGGGSAFHRAGAGAAGDSRPARCAAAERRLDRACRLGTAGPWIR